MTVTPESLLFYAGALVILWITPGPVFVALSARALTGGFRSAWPLAVGVTIGDVLWPMLAIFGLTWIVGQADNLMTVLRWVAAVMFVGMGALLLRHADRRVHEDGRLTRPGLWAAFSTGVAAVIGNPKAILFYMGLLPGFFDLTRVNGADIAAIVVMSALIPLSGNLLTAFAVGKARHLLATPRALRSTNLLAGALLVCVGIAIALH